MFDFLGCFSHPQFKQVASLVVTHGLRDVSAGIRCNPPKAVQVLAGGQSRVQNSNAYGSQRRETMSCVP